MRNIYILKLMYFQCDPRIPKIKQLQIWMKLGVHIVSGGVCRCVIVLFLVFLGHPEIH